MLGRPPRHTLTTVGASLAAADAILADPGRDKNTCKSAKCLPKEVTNRHGLHHTSLLVAKEAGAKIRLNWDAPIMDDGSGEASSYPVWRRALNANSAFVQLGVTDRTTFVDGAAADGQFEYEVTFTIEP